MAKSRSRKVKITKELLITILVIAIIAAIVLGVLYAVRPDLFKMLFGIKEEPPANIVAREERYSFQTSDKFYTEQVVHSEDMTQKLEVHFIDIGQGDSIFIRFPDGKNMLIDAGGEYTSKHRFDKESVADMIIGYIRALGVTQIDAMLLTHSDADHSGEMDDVLNAFEVKKIFLPDFDGSYDGSDGVPGSIPTKTAGKVYKLAKEEKYRDASGNMVAAEIVYNIDDVDNISGDGYSVKSYCRSAEYYDTVTDNAKLLNSVSPITVLEYADTKVMFTGDGEGDGANDVEHWFIDKNIPIDVDVLKVGHHGSRTSTTTDFLNYVDPEYAVISCGFKHGHPTDEILERLRTYKDVKPDGDADGIKRVFRTDIDSTIIMTIDGTPKQEENKQDTSPSVMAWTRDIILNKQDDYALVA